ncbi:hypothetical protein BKK81_09320 [Cupriavidus sp. USMAHM13]|uniref:FAD-dependent oxidoreductase n=1 Tax=Cupriavidus sp. USMAHM13 TaxID=1389192 RepID=UPI0008A6FBA1|nr:FAD-dependent monooxygenase [Cupriavidus sp. USMAHM13]AOY99443.1 hypothetical protein BKK81_09320 [Cupriavidus sp. USMAHM13]
MKGLHVSIIGAGLGGLCLAQGLQRAGIAFDVFERDARPDSRAQGYRIRIDADGQRALSACLPPGLDVLFRHSCAVAASAGSFFDTGLRPTRGRPAPGWRRTVDEAGAPAGGDLSAHRQTLREILLCGIESRVHFGKSYLRHAPMGQGGLRVAFDDGTALATSVLVGADGVHSPVRAQLAPAAAPEDTGAVCFYGRSAAMPALRRDAGAAGEALCQGTSVIFADGFAAILDPMRFREPLPQLAARLAPGCRLGAVEDYFYWAVIGPRARVGPADAEATPARRFAQVAGLVADWHPVLRTVFDQTDPRSIAMLPVRSARQPALWPAGEATLLGDAAHAMSPAGGVGANTALQDAAELAACLAAVAGGYQALPAALGRYEAGMRERAAAALEASAAAAARLAAAMDAADAA